MQGLYTALASGKDVKLSTDIDCSGSEWNPVGTEENPFTGTFDGNGYKISNLTITGDNNVALIAFAGDGAIIKNLNLENVNINSERNAAGVISEATGGLTLENIKVSGTINAANYAAGLVNFPDNATISNCENNAEINAKYSAGISAWIEGSAKVNNVTNNGKIIGETAAAGVVVNFIGNIKNAVNNGEVVSNGTWAAGGIVSRAEKASTYEYCFNYGNVTSTVDNANSSAAGILGQVLKTATLNYCANYGNITAEGSYAAGIAYSLYGGITANYCYNNGTINGADGAGAVAPKPQYGSNDNAKNCLNAGTITSNGKTYQGANNNVSCYYYSGNSLLNVSNNEVAEQQAVLQTLNGGTDTNFFTISNGKISVER